MASVVVVLSWNEKHHCGVPLTLAVAAIREVKTRKRFCVGKKQKGVLHCSAVSVARPSSKFQM